jgi:hypothetical protein
MTWKEALNTAGHLGKFGERIIPHLENIIKSKDESKRTITAVIRALGNTKSSKAFNVIISLLRNNELGILSNDNLALLETVNALAFCGETNLKELMKLMDHTKCDVRTGGMYACGSIILSTEQSSMLVDAFSKKLRRFVVKDRSATVREMAKYITECINGRESIKETYAEALAYLSERASEESLYSRYGDIIDDLLAQTPFEILKPNGNWIVIISEEEGFSEVRISLERSSETLQEYLIISARITELPERNILPLYRQLLELNRSLDIGTTKFFVDDNLVCLLDIKPIDVINPKKPQEFFESIETVLATARIYEERIVSDFCKMKNQTARNS